MGKTRKDAQQQAAENALHSLAGKILLLFVFQGRFLLLKQTLILYYYINFARIIYFNK
jgi:hypothetical protein